MKYPDPAGLKLYDRAGPWTLMARTELDGHGQVAVLEDLTRPDGPIMYLAGGGPLLVLPKTLAATAEPATGLYRGHTLAEVLGDVDLLRNEFLAGGHEPTWAEVAAAFPPIRRAVVETGSVRSNPHTFVGTPQTIDTIPVYYGREYGHRLNPLALTPELAPAIDGEYVEEGIVGGWLPAVRTVYPVAAGVGWDATLFAGVHTRNLFQQPTFHRYLRIAGGAVDRALYFNSYLPYPLDGNCDAAQFYRELFDLHSFWGKAVTGPVQTALPLAWLPDFVRHAFALEAITRVGDHPRYGTVTKDYGGGEHDGFQDVFNTSVSSATEWGRYQTARSAIDNYFTEFVRDDGSIDYRGPEIGQYGRMLSTLSQYAEYSGDYEVFDRYTGRIAAIVQILATRLATARARPAADPSHGLIRGRQEADTSFLTADVAVHDYEQPYWNNSALSWRGFRDLSRVWRHLGTQRNDAGLRRAADDLAASASRLRRDLDRAVERSLRTGRDLSYLPPYAGGTKYHIDSPYRATPESFDDNRVWTEFMGSGVIGRPTLDVIVAYQAAHHGSNLGIMTNRKHIVVFLAHGAGYGFLQHDLIESFLLLYWSLLAHGYTRGTWTAFECVDLDRQRAEHTPFAAAAQLVVAPLTKWMLVFEDPGDDSVWLAKATPRDWLAAGQRIEARGVPTRYGTVGYTITSRLDDRRVEAEVEVDPNGARDPSAFRLRLRTPERREVTEVEIDGARWTGFDADREYVTLPGFGGTYAVTVYYA